MLIAGIAAEGRHSSSRTQAAPCCTFHGVVDEYRFRAHAALSGDAADVAGWLDRAASDLDNSK